MSTEHEIRRDHLRAPAAGSEHGQSQVGIGAAAARYGLTPSTLRWWERQAVIDPPPRAGGYRRYTARDLRQIAMAHLCCSVGKMPLRRAAVVTSRTADRGTWCAAVAEQLTYLRGQIDELTAAHDYLDHLRRCPEEIVSDCPNLDAPLPGVTAPAKDTPTTHSAPPPDTSAAQLAEPGTRAAGQAPAQRCCPCCERPIPSSSRPGRPRVYCSRRCQQRAYRARRAH